MKLRLLNTSSGLRPLYDEDYDEKRKLKIGAVYTATLSLDRNPQFHRKLFALIKTAWELLPERQTAGFGNIENFRKYVTVAAGFTETYYSPKTKQYEEMPRSWAFDSMDSAEFESLYTSVLDVVMSIVSHFVSEDEFLRILQFG